MRTLIRSAVLALGLLPGFAHAQSSSFPQTMPSNSVAGRLGVSAGPIQAIPFLVFLNNLPLASGKILIGSAGNLATPQTPSGDCTLSLSGVITCTKSVGAFTVNGLLTVTGNLSVSGVVIDANGELMTNIVAPAAPAAGTTRIYVDSTQKVLTFKNDAGTVGNAVVPSTAVATQYMTGISAAGVITRAQPAFTDLAGQGTCAQEPALTGDVTTPSGSCATTFATVNANTGSWGTATQVPQFTVNAKGLVTAAANVTVTPAVGSVTGLGTGVATALGVNVGSAGAPVVNGGALGTPSSGTGTNLTGVPTTGLTGTLQAAQEPAHTGDMTNTAGSVATTVVAINGVNQTTAWTAYTPTSAFSTPGTSVMGTPAGRWKQIGKVIFFSVDAAVTTVGTGTGGWIIGLPAATNASNLIVGASGKEVSTLGVLLAIQGASATTVSVSKYDNTSLALGGNGTRVQFIGTYEAQ